MAEQPAGTDNAIGYFIILIILAALSFLIWYLYQTEIIDFIRTIRWYEMWALSFIVPEDYTVSYGDIVNVSFHDLFEKADKYDPSQIDGDLFGLIASAPMQVIQYPTIGLLIIAAIWCIVKGPNTQHRKKFDLNGLIKRQSEVFPIISPFAEFNPSKQPVRPPGSPVPAELPLFSEALGPEEWIAYNSIPVPDGKLDEEVAKKAFIKQLGKPWRGPLRLKPYRQILLAAFCLKAARKRTESDNMLGELATCWNYKTGLKIKPQLLRKARKVLKNRDLAGPTIRLCNQHAYQNTALIRALLNAREEGGVLAPAQFVWLRGYDRELWYPLNNLGRQSFHMEALGAMAHFKAEKLIRRPIPKPRINDAVKTISEYMLSSRARPIPALDYSKSKKRGIKKVKTG